MKAQWLIHLWKIGALCTYNLFQGWGAGSVSNKSGQNSADKRNQRVSAFKFLAWEKANSGCFRWKKKSSWRRKSGETVRLLLFIILLGVTVLIAFILLKYNLNIWVIMCCLEQCFSTASLQTSTSPRNFYYQRSFLSCNWWEKVIPRTEKWVRNSYNHTNYLNSCNFYYYIYLA